MNDSDHHVHYEDELAAYMLDALAPEEAQRFERHLEDCPRCQKRARWLRSSVEMLPAAVEQVEPPPSLREHLMATVRAEAEVDRPVPKRPSRRWSWRDLLAVPRPVLAIAGVLVVMVAGSGYVLGAAGEGDATVTLKGQAPPGTTAVVERTGDHGTLQVSGLPQHRDGIYEVWIARGSQVRPSTLFQVHRDGSGAAAIPEGLAGADQVMVTLEPAGGSAKPTGTPIIVTQI